MTSTTLAATTTGTTRRTPPTAVVAASLSVLMGLVGGYGALYFTGQEGWTDLGLTFVFTYEFLAAFGLVSALALLRRREWGRWGVAVYGGFMVWFTLIKLATIQETEAVPFGVLGLVVLVLATRPAVRRWTRPE
jgi:hypothetical protein